MKKTFTIIGYIAAGLVVVIAIAAIIFIPRALHLQKEGIAYVSSNLRPIVENWDEHALVARATPELMKEVKSPDDLSRLFRYFKTLGSLKSLQPPVPGNVKSGTTMADGAYTVADYTVEGEFEKGSATISLQLLKEGDSWKINGFHVNSEAFLPK